MYTTTSSKGEDFTATDPKRSHRSARSGKSSRSRSSMQTTQECTQVEEGRRRAAEMQKKKETVKEWLCNGCLIFALIIFLALVVAGGYFFYKERQNIRDQTRNIVTVFQEAKYLLDKSVTPFKLVVNYLTGKSEEPGSEFGYSNGYLRAALHIQEAMNLSVDPCEDFYEYTCGNFETNNPIPNHLTSMNYMRKLSDENNEKIQKLMESTTHSSSKAINKLRSFYHSCLDKKAYEQEAVSRALDLHKAIGHFPLLEGDHPDAIKNFSLQQLMNNLAREDLSPMLFELSSSRDLKMVTKRILAFGEGTIPLKSEHWLNQTTYKKLIEAYRTATRSRFELFANDTGYPANPNLDRDLTEIFEFYTKMAAFMATPLQKRNIMAMHNMEKFSSFASRFMQKTGGLNLREMLLSGRAPKQGRKFYQHSKLEVNVAFPAYVDKIAELIRKTPAKVLLNFVHLQVSQHYADFFPQKYQDIRLEFSRTIYGTTEDEPLWQRCLEQASSVKTAFGAIYVRHHFSQETKRAVLYMIDDLRSSFEEIVQEADWMDEETRQLALNKSKQMFVKIGYKNNSFDDALLDQEYDDWNLDKKTQNFLDMVKETTDYLSRQGWREFLGPYNREVFSSLTTQVDAYNSPTENAIIFPAAILQPPFFDRDYPKALNYGGIGSVIGHEITHGFDDKGKGFDHMGNMRDWWTKETNENYAKKAKCMREQYDGLVVENTDGDKLNGQLTLGENIADNGGIREAFRAYRKYLQKRGKPEKKVPGFELTNEQLFFVGYSQVWCGAMRKESEKQFLLRNTHSPMKIRSNVVLSNQPEFAKAFRCPAGSPMNPEKRCAVW